VPLLFKMMNHTQETLSVLLHKILTPRDQEVLSRSLKLLRTWVDSDLFREILMRLLQLPKEFKKIRTAPHLSRVIYSHHFLKKKVCSFATRVPLKRHLFVKLLRTKLQFPFGEKNVLGLLVVFNPLKRRELFEEHHLLAAARRIVPSVQGVEGSFIDQSERSRECHALYYEIEKSEKGYFSQEEIAALQDRLPEEIKGSIEQLVPTTFMRRNEEEMFRSIVVLRDQLKEREDLPQTTISFEEQTQFDLFFTVVMLRWVQDGEPSIQSLLHRHSPDLIYIPDRVDIVGSGDGGFKKEATVFRLQVPKVEFFRKDRSVNLYKARQYVVALLSQALGPIRDYNGGLMVKQNERLEDFFSLVQGRHDDFLMENFFYSITPIAMQSILPAPSLRNWYLLLQGFIEKGIQEEGFAYGEKKIDETYYLHFCSEDGSFKEALKECLGGLGLPSLEYAVTEIVSKGVVCFGILYRPSQFGREEKIKEATLKAMEVWSGKQKTQAPFKISIREGDPNLDPRVAKGNPSSILIKLLFEGLMRLGKGGTPEPAIARSYKVSSDYKRFVFYLRESRWSNGTPLTAYDFEYSWKKAVTLAEDSPFSMILNADKVRSGECSLDALGVVALDEHTLEVHLEYPAPYFLEVAAHWSFSLINRGTDQAYPGWAYHAGETFVSNGPFKLAQWHHGRKLTLEKNSDYWDVSNVHLDKMEVFVHGAGENEIQMIQKKELDFFGRPLNPSPPLLEVHDTNIQQVEYPLRGVFALYFNVEEFPFNHKKLRQALCLALDPAVFRKVCSNEYGGAPFSFIPQALSLHKEKPFPDYDPERASALFRKGLGEIGFVLSDFPKLTLQYPSGMGRFECFREIQRMWQEVLGIRVHLEKIPLKRHYDKLANGEFQLVCMEMQAQWEDPLHLLESFEHKTHPLNFSRWEMPSYRELIRSAKACKTMGERNQTLAVAEAFVAQELPLFPLFEIRGYYLKREGIEGELPQPCFQIDFKSLKKN
jgi:oligopeptide transport system substrate-binding protein